MARRTIAGVVALALLSVLMAAATCAAGRNPAEPFTAWAERNRFQQVNDDDTLGMAAAKICYVELKGEVCFGRNRAALDAICAEECRDLGYTSGGMCSEVTSICICQKPCKAEKTTNAGDSARVRGEAANAGDI